MRTGIWPLVLVHVSNHQSATKPPVQCDTKGRMREEKLMIRQELTVLWQDSICSSHTEFWILPRAQITAGLYPLCCAVREMVAQAEMGREIHFTVQKKQSKTSLFIWIPKYGVYHKQPIKTKVRSHCGCHLYYAITQAQSGLIVQFSRT